MINRLLPDEAQIARLTPRRSREIMDSLTQRQTEVLTELACYRERKEIARDLDISYTRVTQHLDGAKDKFGIENLSNLKIAFLIASYQCDRPIFKEKQLHGTNLSFHQLVATGRFGELHDLYVDRDFKQFIRDRRSSGWGALDAWFGLGWRPIGIVLVTLTAIAMVVGMLFMSDWITERFEPKPSSQSMETRPMNSNISQQLSDGFHAIEEDVRALNAKIARQLALANDVAKDNGIPAIETQRTFKHLHAAVQTCGDLSSSMALSHTSAQKLGEVHADIPWRCPDDAEEKPDLRVVGIS